MEYSQHNELVAEHHLFNNGRDYGNTFSSELTGKYLFLCDRLGSCIYSVYQMLEVLHLMTCR